MKARLLAAARMNALLDECEQLINIVCKSLITAKGNRAN